MIAARVRAMLLAISLVPISRSERISQDVSARTYYAPIMPVAGDVTGFHFVAGTF